MISEHVRARRELALQGITVGACGDDGAKATRVGLHHYTWGDVERDLGRQ